MSQRPESMPENDVVDLLLRQHEEIRGLFREVEGATGDARVEGFDRLRRYLAVHETAEEEIVHPFARRALPDGGKVIDARLEEEKRAKELLQELEQLGAEAVDFPKLLKELHSMVDEHAKHEEKEEFPQIRKESTKEQLRGMATAVKAAEAIAPTHPHPGVESPTANIVIGPLASVMDRTRDVIRQTMKRQKS